MKRGRFYFLIFCYPENQYLIKIKLDENISRHLELVTDQRRLESIAAEYEGLLGKMASYAES